MGRPTGIDARRGAQVLAWLLALTAGTAQAGELVGRVVGTMDAKVFAGAVVSVRATGSMGGVARTDAQGFFRLPELPAGPYLLDVGLTDGRAFLARLVMRADRKTQYLELDYSRTVPPDDDEDY